MAENETSLITLFLFKYFGSDPSVILGGLNASPEQIDAIREQLGLNKPVWEHDLRNGLRLQDNGLESMVGSMHFGHFRLMERLLPALKSAPEARVVVTSSVAHWAGYIDEASFRDHTRHRIGFRAYGQAKLANLIYARELARRTAGSGLRVNAFHPGGVATGIWRELPGPVQAIVDRVLITAVDRGQQGFGGRVDHPQVLGARRPLAIDVQTVEVDWEAHADTACIHWFWSISIRLGPWRSTAARKA